MGHCRPRRCSSSGAGWRRAAPPPPGGLGNQPLTGRLQASHGPHGNPCSQPRHHDGSNWGQQAACRSSESRSNPEIGLADRRVVRERLSRPAHGDAAGLDDEAATCDLESGQDILFDEKDRDAFAIDLQQRFAQPLDQTRREPSETRRSSEISDGT